MPTPIYQEAIRTFVRHGNSTAAIKGFRKGVFALISLTDGVDRTSSGDVVVERYRFSTLTTAIRFDDKSFTIDDPVKQFET